MRVQESLQEDSRDEDGGEIHHHLPAGEQLLRGHRQGLQGSQASHPPAKQLNAALIPNRFCQKVWCHIMLL
jgi:hypothetical protein